MTRPLRLEFAGALYHLTSRGDRKGAIFRDDVDRHVWMETVGLVAHRFNFVVHAYCQMTNHYHVLLETVEGNLSQGMRQLNGIYSQYFNRRHELAGHVFQGRYKAILVQKETHLLELARYVVLNPLRAGIVDKLEDWPWSSHWYISRGDRSPEWLAIDWLLSQFGNARSGALSAYEQFVMAGRGLSSPLKKTRYQLILGDDAFAARHRSMPAPQVLRAVSKAQRRVFALPLAEYKEKYACPKEAMAHAYFSTAYTMAQIGAHFGVSYKHVSRAVKAFEKSL